MRLTRHTDYALRLLMFLGAAEGRPRSIREIAEAFAISENHLTKVAHRLRRMGLVATTRGRKGGLQLARAPHTINLGELVRRTEEDLCLVACFAAADACRISAACVLRTTLGEALAAFFAVLDRYSLEDLLRPSAALSAQLGLTAPRSTGLVRP